MRRNLRGPTQRDRLMESLKKADNSGTNKCLIAAEDAEADLPCEIPLAPQVPNASAWATILTPSTTNLPEDSDAVDSDDDSQISLELDVEDRAKTISRSLSLTSSSATFDMTKFSSMQDKTAALLLVTQVLQSVGGILNTTQVKLSEDLSKLIIGSSLLSPETTISGDPQLPDTEEFFKNLIPDTVEAQFNKMLKDGIRLTTKKGAKKVLVITDKTPGFDEASVSALWLSYEPKTCRAAFEAILKMQKRLGHISTMFDLSSIP